MEIGGRIAMLDPTSRFLARVAKTETCWLWLGALMPRGYGRMRLEGRDQYAHRCSLKLLRDIPVPDDKVVMHLCDNPRCVNPEHLRVGTQTDNMRDAASKGRTVNVSDWRGTRNPKAKLSAEDRATIERELQGGAALLPLARRFAVTKVRIRQIRQELIGA